jgi:excisionase family DNA binding protein
MSTPTLEPGYMDLSDGSRYSGLSVSTLRRLLAAGRLTAYRPTGTKVLISLAELRRFVESSRQTEAANG